MMFVKNNQISGRQTARLLLFELLGYGALLVPAALAQTTGRDGIFSIGIGILAGFFYLRILKMTYGQRKESYTNILIEVCVTA